MISLCRKDKDSPFRCPLTGLDAPGFAGVGFVFVFALLATILAGIPVIQAAGLHALIIGMIGGMIYSNGLGRFLPQSWAPGIAFSARKILRVAIVFYGFRITFQNIFDVGLSGIIVSVLMVALTFLLGLAAGMKLFKLDRDLSILIASGAAICGAAAVLATESTIKAAAWKSTVAVATVVLFGTTAMFLYPFVYNLGWVPLSPSEMGLYIGGSVHEVAHVVAAGTAINPEAANDAVIVKMIRVMMLAPFLLLLGWALVRFGTGEKKGDGGKIVMPWFAVLFIVMAGVNSLGIIPAAGVDAINVIDGFLLTMAVCALGLETKAEKFKGVGMRPIYLAALLFAWLICGGFAITKMAIAVFGA
ncbi:MAG: YeiH family putative sulfate export transporter [Rhodospirillales bacterium]|nr:YeiH family putative sulfate export transporter [Rhodospirillales bacterium]MCB9997179.1 YeiH family putative sulfate export transporter [Rhodospirillales bacterium]